jgi:hypothetical protein
MSLRVSAADVPEDTARVADRTFTTKAVYGNEAIFDDRHSARRLSFEPPHA